jgi:hypothetical protein
MPPFDPSYPSYPSLLDLMRASAWDPPNLPLFKTTAAPASMNAAPQVGGGSLAATLSSPSARAREPRMSPSVSPEFAGRLAARANRSLVDAAAAMPASARTPSEPSASSDNEDEAPSRFSPAKPGWHFYRTSNPVCAPEDQCTPEEMIDAHARFGVPGRDPSTRLEDGQRSTAKDPLPSSMKSSVPRCSTEWMGRCERTSCSAVVRLRPEAVSLGSRPGLVHL